MLPATLASAAVEVWGDLLHALGQEFVEICTPACEKSLKATNDLHGHLTNYFNTLKNLTIAMNVLMLIESVFVCVSSTTWKQRENKVVTLSPAKNAVEGPPVRNTQVVSRHI